MITILLVLTMVLLGVNAFVWFSWVKDGEYSMASGSGSSTTMNKPKMKTPVERKKSKPEKTKKESKLPGFGSFSDKLKTKKDKKQKFNETFEQNIDAGIDFDLGGEDDFDIGEFGIKERNQNEQTDQFDDFGDIGDLGDDTFGDLDNFTEINKEDKEPKELSIEDEFAELFQNQTNDFKSSGGSVDELGASTSGSMKKNSELSDEPVQKPSFNDFPDISGLDLGSGPSTEEESDDLSFLDNYDFGKTEEIDETAFEQKKTRKREKPKKEESFDDFDLDLPPIPGLNYEDESQETKIEKKTDKEKATSGYDDVNDILEELEKLKEMSKKNEK